MPHRLRKTRYLRGSRTVGYGRVGQHRKSGWKGGVGNAGMHKHKWSYTLKYAPDHFGKYGFKSIYPRPTEINLSDLEKFIRADRVKETEGGLPLIDLEEEGYEKLLGKGRPPGPIVIRVKMATKRAIEKVEAAGGKVVLTSTSEGEI